jgi:hypothetical protein
VGPSSCLSGFGFSIDSDVSLALLESGSIPEPRRRMEKEASGRKSLSHG